jgi:hypothetical protein
MFRIKLINNNLSDKTFFFIWITIFFIIIFLNIYRYFNKDSILFNNDYTNYRRKPYFIFQHIPYHHIPDDNHKNQSNKKEFNINDDYYENVNNSKTNNKNTNLANIIILFIISLITIKIFYIIKQLFKKNKQKILKKKLEENK